MSRVINFNAGPAGLPLPALERARDEFIEFGKSGMSIMEHSHRGKDYEGVHNEAIALLKELLAVPATHEVLFMQGGAHLQFSTIPLNFLPPGKTADYVITGNWANVAASEAKKLGALGVGKVNVAGNTEVEKKFTRVPTQAELKLTPDATYVHTTSNNTIFGTQFQAFPDTGAVPHICDMSSDILSRKLDVSKFGMIYAGAQKNIGPSGVTVVIVKKDALARCTRPIPSMLDYRIHVKKESLYNTPSTVGIFVIEQVLQWIQDEGGLSAIHARNEDKAARLYAELDRTAFWRPHANPDSRSRMNVTWRIHNPDLEAVFIKEATAVGLNGLKGHRDVGGLRASIYNACPTESVDALIAFMKDFEKRNG